MNPTATNAIIRPVFWLFGFRRLPAIGFRAGGESSRAKGDSSKGAEVAVVIGIEKENVIGVQTENTVAQPWPPDG